MDASAAAIAVDCSVSVANSAKFTASGASYPVSPAAGV
jgi:hypothetical protein